MEVFTAIFCQSPNLEIILSAPRPDADKNQNLDLGVGPSVVVFWRLTPKVQKQGVEELPVDKASRETRQEVDRSKQGHECRRIDQRGKKRKDGIVDEHCYLQYEYHFLWPDPADHDVILIHAQLTDK